MMLALDGILLEALVFATEFGPSDDVIATIVGDSSTESRRSARGLHDAVDGEFEHRVVIPLMDNATTFILHDLLNVELMGDGSRGDGQSRNATRNAPDMGGASSSRGSARVCHRKGKLSSRGQAVIGIELERIGEGCVAIPARVLPIKDQVIQDTIRSLIELLL